MEKEVKPEETKAKLKATSQQEEPDVFVIDKKRYRFNTGGVILPATKVRNEKGEQGNYVFGKYAGKQVTKQEVLNNPELLNLIISNKLGFIREINEKGGN